MGSLPTDRVDVATVAFPPDKGDVPKAVVPLVNVTVPVAPEGSVAVKMTDCPVCDGFAEEASETTGVSLDTVWFVVPVAGLLFESPP